MSKMTHIAKAPLLILSLIVLTGCRSIFPPAFTSTSKMYIQSAHQDRFVIAQGEEDNWSLRQRSNFDECGWFTIYDLGKDELGQRRIALKTCKNRFVTVPKGDTTRTDAPKETRRDRMVWQEARPGDCTRFTLVAQDDGMFAFKTCGGRYLTAGDAGVGWEGPLNWAIIVENHIVEDWEKFTLRELP